MNFQVLLEQPQPIPQHSILQSTKGRTTLVYLSRRLYQAQERFKSVKADGFILDKQNKKKTSDLAKALKNKSKEEQKWLLQIVKLSKNLRPLMPKDSVNKANQPQVKPSPSTPKKTELKFTEEQIESLPPNYQKTVKKLQGKIERKKEKIKKIEKENDNDHLKKQTVQEQKNLKILIYQNNQLRNFKQEKSEQVLALKQKLKKLSIKRKGETMNNRVRKQKNAQLKQIKLEINKIKFNIAKMKQDEESQSNSSLQQRLIQMKMQLQIKVKENSNLEKELKNLPLKSTEVVTTGNSNSDTDSGSETYLRKKNNQKKSFLASETENYSDFSFESTDGETLTTMSLSSPSSKIRRYNSLKFDMQIIDQSQDESQDQEKEEKVDEEKKQNQEEKNEEQKQEQKQDKIKENEEEENDDDGENDGEEEKEEKEEEEKDEEKEEDEKEEKEEKEEEEKEEEEKEEEEKEKIEKEEEEKEEEEKEKIEEEKEEEEEEEKEGEEKEEEKEEEEKEEEEKEEEEKEEEKTEEEKIEEEKLEEEEKKKEEEEKKEEEKEEEEEKKEEEKEEEEEKKEEEKEEEEVKEKKKKKKKRKKKKKKKQEKEKEKEEEDEKEEKKKEEKEKKEEEEEKEKEQEKEKEEEEEKEQEEQEQEQKKNEEKKEEENQEEVEEKEGEEVIENKEEEKIQENEKTENDFVISSTERLFTIPMAVEYFKEYLYQEMCQENILFFLAVKEYKNSFVVEKKMISMANDIYKKYIKTGAIFEVNIDYKCRDVISKKINQKNITKTIFDEAQSVVFIHMDHNQFGPFKSSQLYKDLLKKLQTSNESQFDVVAKKATLIKSDRNIKVLNTEFWFTGKSRNACKVIEELMENMISILNSWYSITSSQIEFDMISKSLSFNRFHVATTELQRVKLKNLNQQELLSFFINAYNLLMLHAGIVNAIPQDRNELRKFLVTSKYNIGRMEFSLDDIFYGILRRNRDAKNNEYFEKNDPRSKLSLKIFEPRIHFSLFSYDSQSIVVQTIFHNNTDKLLDKITHFQISKNIIVQKNKIFLPKNLKNYLKDFGESMKKITLWIHSYLPSYKKKTLKPNEQQISIKFLKEKTVLPIFLLDTKSLLNKKYSDYN
ncbi:electron carrier/ protein disulfide oxidoreductase [Anaeramoeba flamelloides]|uniref:Electron carrier/ protein disulfide oxidoreductase n=1 Tax=Anaeramoeba flamelloides TaxID=1746091 RepID=A0ABQ8X5M1_9EUKA|nr:electron carrier/ protein disulfide oxidoreductase [Anaeramoeba flamelloides]